MDACYSISTDAMTDVGDELTTTAPDPRAVISPTEPVAMNVNQNVALATKSGGSAVLVADDVNLPAFFPKPILSSMIATLPSFARIAAKVPPKSAIEILNKRPVEVLKTSEQREVSDYQPGEFKHRFPPKSESYKQNSRSRGYAGYIYDELVKESLLRAQYGNDERQYVYGPTSSSTFILTSQSQFSPLQIKLQEDEIKRKRKQQDFIRKQMNDSANVK
jgi:hypothetical protein